MKNNSTKKNQLMNDDFFLGLVFGCGFVLLLAFINKVTAIYNGATDLLTIGFAIGNFTFMILAFGLVIFIIRKKLKRMENRP